MKVKLICDVCGKNSDEIEISLNNAKNSYNGWLIFKDNAYCPDCEPKSTRKYHIEKFNSSTKSWSIVNWYDSNMTHKEILKNFDETPDFTIEDGMQLVLVENFGRYKNTNILKKRYANN